MKWGMFKLTAQEQTFKNYLFRHAEHKASELILFKNSGTVNGEY